MAKLLILSGKRKGLEFELPGEGEVVDIGNRDSAKLAIHDPWISFNHAEIKHVGGRYLIEDQGSSNGTWVLKGTGAERVERHELTSEDVFALGNTRVRFVGGAPSSASKAAPAAADDSDEKPWWDKVIQDDGAGKADGQRVRLLKRELAEERRMRQALEKFLDLSAGATVGDAAQAGALEQRVRELESQLEQAKEGAKTGVLPQGDMLARHTERLRRGHMSEVVSLEGRATTAEAKVADLEERLKERTEAGKKDRAEHRTEVERLQHEIEELKSKGGDPDATVDDRLTALQDELSEARKALAAVEERRAVLETELREARESSVDKSDMEGIKAELKAALEQVAHHKGEQARLVQELDDVSMEQIEIEERLQSRVRALEAQLKEAGLQPAPADANDSDDDVELADDASSDDDDVELADDASSDDDVELADDASSDDDVELADDAPSDDDVELADDASSDDGVELADDASSDDDDASGAPLLADSGELGFDPLASDEDELPRP